MAKPKDPLLEELLSVFHAWDGDGQRYLDLPRASIVESIPEHRPDGDFIEIAADVVQMNDDLHAFTTDPSVGIDPDDHSHDDLLDLLEKRGLGAAFEAFRRQRSRQRIRDWLESKGVIYT